MNKIRFIIDEFFQNVVFSIFGSQGSRQAFRKVGVSRATTILGVFGHLIILMSLVDFVVVIIPPQAQNPVWELETINLLMSQVWFFFAGFALVIISYLVRFYLDGEANILTVELIWFKFLRWVVLFMAIVCVLMPPLIVVDTIRVNNLNNRQIDQTRQNQLAQLSQIENQLPQVQDLNELRYLLPSGSNFSPGLSLSQVKQEIQNNLTTQKERISTESAKLQAQKRFTLFKSSIRNVIASLLSFLGTFLLFWRTRQFID
ncbi:MAG: hypothetical protein RLZZ490_1322 [Cyanobacteriota bacterium]|jgi:hypothetical protein